MEWNEMVSKPHRQQGDLKSKGGRERERETRKCDEGSAYQLGFPKEEELVGMKAWSKQSTIASHTQGAENPRIVPVWC